MDSDSATNAGTILLLFAAHDLQTAEQIAKDSGLSAAEVARQLHRLTEFGFILAGAPDANGVQIYRLNPKGVRTEAAGPTQRILLVDDTDAIRNLVSLILEDAGYAVIATTLPVNAVGVLDAVEFDLVITDSYGSSPREAFASTAAIVRAAGATPVALFSAHRVNLAEAQAAGFRDVIAKPFDVDVLEQQVRRLLADNPRGGAPHRC